MSKFMDCPRQITFNPAPVRGLRLVHYKVSGTDAYGKPVTEQISNGIHWRKYKRLYGRKAGHNARSGH